MAEPEQEGHEPTEDVGPSKCDAGAETAEFRAHVLDGKPQESQHTLADEVGEQFPLEPIPMVMHPLDGMPTPMDENPALAIAPPFDFDHVVCVADDRRYVELWQNEAVERGCVTGSVRGIDGLFVHGPWKIQTRPQFDQDGNENTREEYSGNWVIKRWGHTFVVSADDERVLIPVRPIREQCIHYKRQVFSNDDNPDKTGFGSQLIFRNCGARRSVGGAFMSLRDEAVFACEWREPADPESLAKYVGNRDARKLRSEDHKTHLPLFNLT